MSPLKALTLAKAGKLASKCFIALFAVFNIIYLLVDFKEIKDSDIRAVYLFTEAVNIILIFGVICDSNTSMATWTTFYTFLLGYSTLYLINTGKIPAWIPIGPRQLQPMNAVALSGTLYSSALISWFYLPKFQAIEAIEAKKDVLPQFVSSPSTDVDSTSNKKCSIRLALK